MKSGKISLLNFIRLKAYQAAYESKTWAFKKTDKTLQSLEMRVLRSVVEWEH